VIINYVADSATPETFWSLDIFAGLTTSMCLYSDDTKLKSNYL